MKITEFIAHSWNVFSNRDPTISRGGWSTYQPGRMSMRTSSIDKSIITAIINRMAVDAASIDIKHVVLDENGRYQKDYDSGLNRCFNLEANIDQTNRAFLLDIYESLFEEGAVGIVPIDTSINPNETESYSIDTMRVSKIIEWYPSDVKIRAYNDRTGTMEERIVPKSLVAIVENPFFSVMNGANSALQRLRAKLSLLDAIDDQSGSGKMDLIIQLPYAARTELQQNRVEERRRSIEEQLTNSKYGIAYIDSTEHITQLNRSVDNNLMNQITYLVDLVFSELGLTPEIMNGTADVKTMENYFNRTIEPTVGAVVAELRRKFLSKTARGRRQDIVMFRDPFRLIPVTEVAEMADKMTRNEIMSSNEFRTVIGLKPVDNPKADELRNKNLSESTDGPEAPRVMTDGKDYNQNGNEG